MSSRVVSGLQPVLRIRVVQGRGLKSSDMGGKADPFVEIACMHKTKEVAWACELVELHLLHAPPQMWKGSTDVKKGTLEPKWNRYTIAGTSVVEHPPAPGNPMAVLWFRRRTS